MSKFKVLERQGQIGIRCKLGSGESINSNEVMYFQQTSIRGIMQPTVEGSSSLIYIGAQGVPLSRFLKHIISKEHYFMIASQLVEIYKTARMNGLDPNWLVLDPDFIVINENSGEMSFIHSAIITTAQINDGFIACFNRIANATSFVTQEDYNAVGEFLKFVNSQGSFSVNEIDSYIANAAPATYNSIPHHAYTEPAAPAPAAEPAPVQAAAPDYEAFARPVETEPQPEIGSFSAAVAEPTSQPVPEPVPQAVAEPTSQPVPEPVPQAVAEPTSQPVPEPVPQAVAEPTSQPVPEPVSQAVAEPTSQPAPEPVPQAVAESTSQPVPEPVPQAVAEPTSQPAPEPVPVKAPEPVFTAKLIRHSNGEEILINKAVFRIGKERAKVDYCITDNKTVSRVHATIFTRNGDCFAADNNSTNRTFINGNPIPVQTEMPLRSGDVLKFSNEEFDFIG